MKLEFERKYEFTGETKCVGGRTLHRIRALRDIMTAQGHVPPGALGGWIEKEANLSHLFKCWVDDEAKVFDNARVFGNALVSEEATVLANASIGARSRIYGKASILGSSIIFDDARILGSAYVFGNAQVYGGAVIDDDACIFGDARVYGVARIHSSGYLRSSDDYITVGPIGSRGDATTFYLTKDRKIMVCCGYFNGEIDAFEAAVVKKHGDSKHAKNYLEVINTARKVLG